MKLTQIMLSKDFGGAERYFVDLCRALAARGHEVQAICQPGSQAHACLRTIDGLRVDTVRVMGAWDPFAHRALRRALEKHGPQIVHTHLARGAWLGGRAAHDLGLPVVTKLHNYVKLEYYRYVDWFNVTTGDQRDYLLTRGIEDSRIRVIPNFSSLTPVATVQETDGVPTRWLTYGRLVHKKGFDLLLKAFAALHAAYPETRLRIGGDGAEHAALRSLVDTLNLAQSVEFLGWVGDVETLLDEAEVFVLPSRDEPFGIVVLEAMSRGIPIVSTRTQGPREILDDTTAWLCAVDDADDLARAMLEAARSGHDRAKRARQALDRYRNTYHEEAVLPRLLSLYAQIGAHATEHQALGPPA